MRELRAGDSAGPGSGVGFILAPRANALAVSLPTGHVGLDPCIRTRTSNCSSRSRTEISGHIVFGSNDFRSPI